MIQQNQQPRLARVLKILVPILTGLIAGIWLFYTPAGLLGKADAVAYAVCHRIPERSFFLGGRQIPLCARCSGMYLGAFIGLMFQSRYHRKGGLPSLKISIALGVFFAAFGIDGVNSYMHFFPQAPWIYDPQNWLRLLTGTGLGLGMAAVIYPIFNQSIWEDWIELPALHSWKQLGVLLSVSITVILMVLSENPLLLYPLALISSFSVIILLTMIYTIVWVLIARKENTFNSWQQISIYVIAGLGMAILQLSVMDAGRYLLTGTWNGFELKGY